MCQRLIHHHPIDFSCICQKHLKRKFPKLPINLFFYGNETQAISITCAMSSTCLFLYGHDLHDLVLESWAELVDDLVLLD